MTEQRILLIEGGSSRELDVYLFNDWKIVNIYPVVMNGFSPTSPGKIYCYVLLEHTKEE